MFWMRLYCKCNNAVQLYCVQLYSVLYVSANSQLTMLPAVQCGSGLVWIRRQDPGTPETRAPSPRPYSCNDAVSLSIDRLSVYIYFTPTYYVVHIHVKRQIDRICTSPPGHSTVLTSQLFMLQTTDGSYECLSMCRVRLGDRERSSAPHGPIRRLSRDQRPPPPLILSTSARAPSDSDEQPSTTSPRLSSPSLWRPRLAKWLSAERPSVS